MKRLALILMALVALGCALVAPAAASDVATAPDGTVTLVSGQQYLRVAPDGTRTPFQDYTLRETEEEGDPSVAVAPDGTATVAWVRIGPVGSAVLVRRIGPDGELEGGVTELVSHSEDSHLNPDVAVAPDGTATVVWTATFGGETFIQSSQIAPDGTASKRVDLAAGGSYSPDVEVAPDGTATVAWHQFGDDSSTAAARQIEPDGSLGDALQLSSGACNSQDPALAVTPSGAAVVVWECIYPHGVGVDPDEILEERRIAPNGVPDKGVNTISAEEDAGAPVVAAGPDGTVTIVWRQSAGPMLERRIEPDGTPEDTIYDVSSPARGIYPKLAIADDGSATLVWSTGWQIFSRRLDPDGAPAGPLREVLSSNGYMNMLGMGFDPEDGSALPIWSRRLGYYETESALEASRLAADGTAGPIFYLTDPGTEPATWADPGSLAFGDVKIGTTVTSQVEFTNRSVDSTPVSGVYLQGPDADQFQIVDAGSCTSQPIPFVSTCSVTVAFTPTSKGPAEAELALAASAPREPRIVPLAGTGAPGNGKGPPSTPPGKGPSFAQLRLDKRHGTARLSLRVPTSGELAVAASCPASRGGKARAQLLSRHVDAGRVSVPVKAKGACRQNLEQDGSVRMLVSVRFTSLEGERSQTTRSLVLRKQAR